VEAKWVDAGAVEVVEEEGRDENQGLGIGGVEAVGKDEEGEPKSWALHEEPGQRWVNGGAPSRTAVLAVGCLEEQ